jgi:sugar phosphate isomerase/epimerase
VIVIEVPLLATCWLTAGDAAPLRGDERSPYALRDRIEAAGAAGFTGFGLPYPDLVPAIASYGIDGIRSMLEANGLNYLELEFIADWWNEGEARRRSDRVRKDLLDAAEKLGAHHIKVGVDVNDGPWDFDHWAAEFATLADQGREAGTRIGLEPMPFANIKTVGEAVRLVEAAGREAGGVLIDSWHVQRAGTDFEELRTLPAERIVGVEIVDAKLEIKGATLWEDCITNRCFAGEGELDLASFVANLQAAGYAGAWGAEVVSDRVRAMSLTDAVETGYRTMTELFNR